MSQVNNQPSKKAWIGSQWAKKTDFFRQKALWPISRTGDTVQVAGKSGDNWVILQNPSFITMGASEAAAFNGPLSFPNWRGITLHSQMRFHFLRTSAFCTPYFILGLTLTQVLSYSRIFSGETSTLHLLAVTWCFTNPRQIPQNSVEFFFKFSSTHYTVG